MTVGSLTAISCPSFIEPPNVPHQRGSINWYWSSWQPDIQIFASPLRQSWTDAADQIGSRLIYATQAVSWQSQSNNRLDKRRGGNGINKCEIHDRTLNPCATDFRWLCGLVQWPVKFDRIAWMRPMKEFAPQLIYCWSGQFDTRLICTRETRQPQKRWLLLLFWIFFYSAAAGNEPERTRKLLKSGSGENNGKEKENMLFLAPFHAAISGAETIKSACVSFHLNVLQQMKFFKKIRMKNLNAPWYTTLTTYK